MGRDEPIRQIEMLGIDDLNALGGLMPDELNRAKAPRRTFLSGRNKPCLARQAKAPGSIPQSDALGIDLAAGNVARAAFISGILFGLGY